MNDNIGIELEDEKEESIIKIIGVGGGGGNAANYMFEKGIEGVDYVICNTDKKAMDMSPIGKQILLGSKGLGAGNKPEMGRQAAIESIDQIEDMLDDHTEMVFVTAGMGGGTGTGAAPVIAASAKGKNILTVGIVTIPFVFEGHNRLKQALEGLNEMRHSVDSIIVITNERIKQLYGDLTLSNAFGEANQVLTTAAKGIAELITKPGFVNVDLEDVRTVLKNSGDAVMGSAQADGDNRALEAIQKALKSPLLINDDIKTARNILLNISSSHDCEVTMNEVNDVTDFLEQQTKEGTQIIWGNNYDDALEGSLQITIIITGINLTDEDLTTNKKSNTAPRRTEANSNKFISNLFGNKEEAKPILKGEMQHMSDEDAGRLAEKMYGRNVLDNNTKANYGNKAEMPGNFKIKVAEDEPAEPAAAQQPQPEEPEPVKAPEIKKHINLDDLDLDEE